MAGKQAKILSKQQQRLALAYLDGTRWPERNRVMFLLSVKAGLRSKEIAALSMWNVADWEYQVLDFIEITDKDSKGKKGGRKIPLNQQLKEELQILIDQVRTLPNGSDPSMPIIRSERAGRTEKTSPQVITNWFKRLYGPAGLNFAGCSSHSGRRTFGTMAARNISAAGGSLKDVKYLMGHSSIQTTQTYIDETEEAKRNVVNMI